jgi:zinc protease
MKRMSWVLSLILTGLPLLASDWPDPRSMKIDAVKFHIVKPEHKKLKNGLDIWMLEDHSLPLISLFMEIDAGNQVDPPDRFGLSEFTGLMLSQGGTRSLSPEQLDEKLADNAIRLTCESEGESIQVSVSCMVEDFDKALEVFKEVILHPGFDESRMPVVRDKIAAEIRRNRDYPFFAAMSQFRKIGYGENHPLARPPSEEELTRIQKADLAAFHRDFFKPDIARIGVSGDFIPGKMLRDLKKAFSEWSGSASKKIQIPQPQPVTDTNHIYLLNKPGTQASIVMGHIGPAPANPDHFSLKLFSRIFGFSGQSSRLFQEVRSKNGLAYMVSGGMMEKKPADIFQVICQTKTQSSFDAANLILKVLEQMRTSPVSDAELEEAKLAMENSFVFNFERSQSILRRLFRHLSLGLGENYLDTYLDQIRCLSAQDILKAVQSNIFPGKIVIVAAGPLDDMKTGFYKLGWPVTVIDPESDK